MLVAACGVWDAGLVHSVGGCMWCLGRWTIVYCVGGCMWCLGRRTSVLCWWLHVVFGTLD